MLPTCLQLGHRFINRNQEANLSFKIQNQVNCQDNLRKSIKLVGNQGRETFLDQQKRAGVACGCAT